MEYIEVTGKSVEEAITNACTKLGIPSYILSLQRLKQEKNRKNQKLSLLRLLRSQKNQFMLKRNLKRRLMI